VRELKRNVPRCNVICRSATLPFLLLGLLAIGWKGFSLVKGKGHYKGCPPGGFDRTENPFNFWAPTPINLALGVCMILTLSVGR
jgi:hypothetical protein